MHILRTVFHLCLGGVLLGASSIFAQSQNMDIRPQAHRVVGEDLLEAFKGITHEGAYNFDLRGRAGNRYTETHHDSGQLTYQEGETVFKGVWLIRRDEMCFSYYGDELGGGCFRVYKVKNCFYFYSTQFRAPKNEVDTEYWTARSVKQGETAECVMGVA